MIKRQQRIEWIAAVAKEYLAAKSAADLLKRELQADPNYGRKQGWDARDGASFNDNLESTYIVRLYAEFEAFAGCERDDLIELGHGPDPLLRGFLGYRYEQ